MKITLSVEVVELRRQININFTMKEEDVNSDIDTLSFLDEDDIAGFKSLIQTMCKQHCKFNMEITK